MTASTPPLVDVIAGALRQHYVGIDPRHNGLRCECGQAVQTDDAAHQARAVLDALAEGGAVEFAVQDASGVYPPGPASTNESDRDEMSAQIAEAKSYGIDMLLVSRMAGPWTAVEG